MRTDMSQIQFGVISDEGLSLIKKFEGLRLTAYQDAVGIWTIGYGHTGPDVTPGMRVTQEQAESLLRKDVAEAEDAVRSLVKAPISQSQYDALVSFVFNVGRTAFMNSTLLRLLNQGDWVSAAAEFAKWHKAGKKALEGLLRRRIEEMILFLRK